MDKSKESVLHRGAGLFAIWTGWLETEGVSGVVRSVRFELMPGPKSVAKGTGSWRGQGSRQLAARRVMEGAMGKRRRPHWLVPAPHHRRPPGRRWASWQHPSAPRATASGPGCADNCSGARCGRPPRPTAASPDWRRAIESDMRLRGGGSCEKEDKEPCARKKEGWGGEGRHAVEQKSLGSVQIDAHRVRGTARYMSLVCEQCRTHRESASIVLMSRVAEGGLAWEHANMSGQGSCKYMLRTKVNRVNIFLL